MEVPLVFCTSWNRQYCTVLEILRAFRHNLMASRPFGL